MWLRLCCVIAYVQCDVVWVGCDSVCCLVWRVWWLLWFLNALEVCVCFFYINVCVVCECVYGLMACVVLVWCIWCVYAFMVATSMLVAFVTCDITSSQSEVHLCVSWLHAAALHPSTLRRPSAPCVSRWFLWWCQCLAWVIYAHETLTTLHRLLISLVRSASSLKMITLSRSASSLKNWF